MNTNSTLFLVFLFLITLRVNGQEAQEEYQNVILNLVSGDTVIYKLSENNTSHITGFKKKTNKDIWKFKIFSEDEVAFYTYLNGQKTWMYQTNPKIGQFLKRDEMEQYILGKRDAKFNYRPKKHFIGGLPFFVDFKNKIDPIVAAIDDFRINGRAVATGPAIGLQNVLNVGLDLGAGQHRALGRPDSRLQRIVVDLLVPLERHPINDRVLRHVDDNSAALGNDLYICKQTGRKKRLERFVDIRRAIGTPDGNSQITQYGLGLDPRHRIGHLVGLQRSNQMQAQVWIALAAGSPARGGFLHTVFTKNPLASSKGCLNPLKGLPFADRDKRNSWRSWNQRMIISTRVCYLLADLGQIGGDSGRLSRGHMVCPYVILSTNTSDYCLPDRAFDLTVATGMKKTVSRL